VSFLVNIIRKGAGLPQEALPRPSPVGVEGLPPTATDDEDAAALLLSETDATFEDEPQSHVEREARAHRPDPITKDADEASSEPTRVHNAAPVAREKRSDGDVGEHARGSRDAVADFRAAHEESESLSPRAPAPTPDDVTFEARPAAPRFTRKSAPDEQSNDFSVRPSSTNTAHPDGDGVAAMISENARTAERRSPFAQRADERASGDEESETAPESFPYMEAARIVPRAPEPAGAGLESSALAGDAASRDSQSESPRVQVRIGTVEVRMSNPTPQPPVPAQARAPRGFESYTAARRYLDRKWY
jgi:hypothetical protein